MEHNIEKSAFRKGQYVGYGGGLTWHVKRDRTSGNWWAYAQGGSKRLEYGRTLAEVGRKLAMLEDEPTGEFDPIDVAEGGDGQVYDV